MCFKVGNVYFYLCFIAKEKLQSPLQVLDCLSIPEGPTLGTAREYFIEVFQQESDNTREVQNIIANNIL